MPTKNRPPTRGAKFPTRGAKRQPKGNNLSKKKTPTKKGNLVLQRGKSIGSDIEGSDVNETESLLLSSADAVTANGISEESDSDTWVVKLCKKWGFDGIFFVNPTNFHHVAVK